MYTYSSRSGILSFFLKAVFGSPATLVAHERLKSGLQPCAAPGSQCRQHLPEGVAIAAATVVCAVL